MTSHLIASQFISRKDPLTPVISFHRAFHVQEALGAMRSYIDTPIYHPSGVTLSCFSEQTQTLNQDDSEDMSETPEKEVW